MTLFEQLSITACVFNILFFSFLFLVCDSSLAFWIFPQYYETVNFLHIMYQQWQCMNPLIQQPHTHIKQLKHLFYYYSVYCTY